MIGIPVDQSAIHSIVGARPGGSAFSVGVRSRRLSRRDGQRLLQTEALNQLGKEEGMKGTLADYVIASVAETALMDVYPYSAEPDVKPEFPDADKR